MKRGHIILVAGAAMLVAGIAISVVWGVSFASSFLADNSIVERTSLGPGESVNATRNVDSLYRPIFLAVGADPQQSQQNDGFRLRETMTDPNGRVVSSNEFQESYSTTVTPEVTGTYTVTISNLGTGPVTIGGAFGHVPFLGADRQPDVEGMMSTGGLGTIITGGGLTIAGVVTLIAGAVITVLDSRKRQGSTATSEGGITYRKD